MTTTPARAAPAPGVAALGPLARVVRRLDRLSDERFSAVLVTPGLLLVGLFVIPPILGVLVLSLFRIELTHDSFRPFVTFRNYAVRLGTDTVFLDALPLTLGLALVVTAIAVPVALFAAIAIRRRSARTGGALALLLLLPWAVAPIAVGIFWRLMFSGDGHLTQLLRALHLPTVVLADAPGVLITTCIALVWRAIPLLAVLFLGALRQVPVEIGRAAQMDGATGWQVFRYVTLPVIWPSVVAACLVQIVLTLHAFEVQFAVVGDAPPDGSVLAAFAIFRTVIGEISLGYGATMTVVLGALIAVCLGLLLRVVTGAARSAEVRPEDPALTVRAVSVPPARSIVAEPLNTPKARRLAGIRSVTARGAKVFAGALLVLWLAGPIVWVIVASTQTRLIQQVPPRLVAPSLTQYQRLVTDPAWQGAAAVSFSVTVIATALALAIAILTAYPLARYRWRGGRPLLAVMLGTQLVPPIALAIPVLFLFAALGLRNSILGLVLVNVAFWTPLLIWLTRSAFLATPANLERAARIDGSSRLGAIFRIALPAAGPAIAAAAAIVFIGIWNDFVFAVSLGGPDTSTLPRYLGQSFAPSYAALSAAIVVTVAPCVALVALFRRRIFQLV